MANTGREIPAYLDVDWQEGAACRGPQRNLFFGVPGERRFERAEREEQAKAICGQCAVRVACFNYAISRREKYGVWGGLGESELRQLYKRT